MKSEDSILKTDHPPVGGSGLHVTLFCIVRGTTVPLDTATMSPITQSKRGYQTKIINCNPNDLVSIIPKRGIQPSSPELQKV